MRMLVPGRPVKETPATPPPVPVERPTYKEKFIPPELSMWDYFVAKVRERPCSIHHIKLYVFTWSFNPKWRTVDQTEPRVRLPFLQFVEQWGRAVMSCILIMSYYVLYARDEKRQLGPWRSVFTATVMITVLMWNHIRSDISFFYFFYFWFYPPFSPNLVANHTPISSIAPPPPCYLLRSAAYTSPLAATVRI